MSQPRSPLSRIHFSRAASHSIEASTSAGSMRSTSTPVPIALSSVTQSSPPRCFSTRGFKDNGFFYVHYASLPFNGDGIIVRFTVDPASPDVVSADRTNETAKVIMRIEQPYYNHNGGQIAFGPDGYLYIGSGDGGWEGDPLQAGKDLSTRLGKILRVDVNTRGQPLQDPGRQPARRRLENG